MSRNIMTKTHCLTCGITNLLSVFLLLTLTNSINAQDNSIETGWLVPLDVGKKQNIQCLNGLLVEFVSDCAPPTCHSLRLSENNILECISRSSNAGDHNP
jgi:hypothetical protein